MKILLGLLITIGAAYAQQPLLGGSGSVGGGLPVIACAGTPGNTTGAYRQLCSTTGGALYVCNNAAGCTVAADWVATGVAGGTGLAPCSDSTNTNAYICTGGSSPPASLTDLVIKAQFTHGNSGACTINIAGLGAKACIFEDGTAFTGGEIQANLPYIFTYDNVSAFRIPRGGTVAGATGALVTNYGVSPPTTDVNTSAVPLLSSAETITGLWNFSTLPVIPLTNGHVLVGSGGVATDSSLTAAGIAQLGVANGGDLIFTDATYDIGKSGATRPRDIFASRNGAFGGTLSVTGHVTLEGVTSTGATGTGKLVFSNAPQFDSSLQIPANSGYYINNYGYFIFSSDGVAKLLNNNFNGFTRLQLGGTTSGFGAIGVTNQTNPIILVRDAAGGNTASLDAGLGVAFATVVGGLTFKTGSNARTGTGTLSGGTLAVSNTSVTANSMVFVQDTGGGVLANIGALYVASQTAGTGFTVTSSNALDTSNFRYWIYETN